MSRPKLCVVGASNLDVISYVERLPRMGETIQGTRFHMSFGGKGANQAVMAAKLGGDVSMVAKLGRDIFGEDMLRNFEAWGIDSRHISFTEDAFSGVASIAVDAEGQNSIIVVTGANDLLAPEEVEVARPAIAAADVLVCQLEIPVASTLAALRIAREEGVRTILNPAPARPGGAGERSPALRQRLGLVDGEAPGPPGNPVPLAHRPGRGRPGRPGGAGGVRRAGDRLVTGDW